MSLAEFQSEAVEAWKAELRRCAEVEQRALASVLAGAPGSSDEAMALWAYVKARCAVGTALVRLEDSLCEARVDGAMRAQLRHLGRL